MSQANWLKKFNLLISVQSTVQQSQLNEEFPKEYDDFRVTDLRKMVIKAVMSDGKVTLIALTFHWWGSNYVEGWVSLNFLFVFFSAFICHIWCTSYFIFHHCPCDSINFLRCSSAKRICTRCSCATSIFKAVSSWV